MTRGSVLLFAAVLLLTDAALAGGGAQRPEDAVSLFYRGFDTGDKALLERILLPGRKVEIPPARVRVTRHDVVRVSRILTVRDPADSSQPGDLELVVDVQWANSLRQRFGFLLRQFPDGWRIVEYSAFDGPE